MNRLLLLSLAVGAGAIGSSVFHRAADQARETSAVRAAEWKASRNRLAQTEAKVAALRGEVRDKKNSLGAALRHVDISPELLVLLEGDISKASPAPWAQLRQQLGIGWDSSPDYVLVSKRVLKQLDYQRFHSASGIADAACEILAFSPAEQSALKLALQRIRETWQDPLVERTEPSGDVVAQYSLRAPDPALEQSLSNSFTAAITGVIGPERADLFLPQGWRQFRSGLGPTEAETVTVRRSMVDGEPDLIVEMKRSGKAVFSEPVRYAHYPSSWFLTLFPGGWATLAQREGFALPRRFENH